MDMLQLERECRSYTRYLIGEPPTSYVIAKYRDFHQKIGVPEARDRFDRFLLAASAHGPLWARLADSYAGIWRKQSSLRAKLVVTLALLECAPPTYEKLDRCPSGGWFGALLRLSLAPAGYACSLLAATALFSPVHLWMKAAGEPR